MTAALGTRRRLLAGGIAAALVAATGLPVQALGRRGGRLTAGLSPDGFDIVRTGATGQCLTEISGDGSLIPALATGWEARKDGAEWHFALRGQMPGAADMLGRLGKVAWQGQGVRVFLDKPDPDLPLRLAAPEYVVPGEPGLYRVLSDEGSRLHLGRTSPHWKEERAGWADEVVLERIEAPAARLAAFRQGRVDVIDALDDHAARMLENRPDVTLTGDLAVSDRVGIPAAIGTLWPLDNGRMAERWWLG